LVSEDIDMISFYGNPSAQSSTAEPSVENPAFYLVIEGSSPNAQFAVTVSLRAEFVPTADASIITSP
jgi:hypothetical protein